MSDIVVSISCITYNHEPYIRECLDGFLMQNTNFTYEILIHDDASTDNTQIIIQEYEKKYPDIIKPIYRTQNQYSQGVRRVNKFNFERARGKYIALCEGDDYWIDPLKLQKQVDFLEANSEYTLCFHNAVKVYYEDLQETENFNNLSISKEIYLDQIINKWIIPTASILFRYSILPLPLWANEIYSGDITLALLAISKGRVFYLDSVMSVYRINKKGSSMTAQIGDNYSFVLNEHIKLYNYYANDELCVNRPLILKKISSLNKELKFQKLKHKCFILSILYMPIYSLKKILNRVIYG